GSASATISLQLRDPGTQTPGGRLTLQDLENAVHDIGTVVAPPTIHFSGHLDLPVTADPFALGGVTVTLSGRLALTESDLHFTLAADIAGALLPELEILAGSRVTYDDVTGMGLSARARAFGVAPPLGGVFDPDG